MVHFKKENSKFGRYPCCDLLNRALRFLLDGNVELAKDDIVHAIYKADGYFYEDVAEKLGLEPVEKQREGKCDGEEATDSLGT